MTEQHESKKITITRGSYDSLEIFEITKDELEVIKQGSPNSIFLNFAIALTSIFISLLSMLLTVKIESDRVFYIFVILTVVSALGGIVTGILWIKGENVFKKTICRIEDRIKNKEYITKGNSISELDSKK